MAQTIKSVVKLLITISEDELIRMNENVLKFAIEIYYLYNEDVSRSCESLSLHLQEFEKRELANQRPLGLT